MSKKSKIERPTELTEEVETEKERLRNTMKWLEDEIFAMTAEYEQVTAQRKDLWSFDVSVTVPTVPKTAPVVFSVIYIPREGYRITSSQGWAQDCRRSDLLCELGRYVAEIIVESEWRPDSQKTIKPKNETVRYVELE